tara:strand:- start:1684 stop:3102 length:1419 start_codon:yes stop_codon:yes gene_type:complete
MKIKRIKNICCIGAGYVGGPTMAVIADRCSDIQINIVDINKERIKAWNDNDISKLPVFEPGLEEIVKRCRNKNLHFSNEIKKHIENADMIFISVNTPTKISGVGAGQAVDLKWVESSARQISKYAQDETIVVEKSTLPVKTAETIKKILFADSKERINDHKIQTKFYVLSNPEFLAEGTAINDLENPDRVLIGGESDEAINSLKKIYLNWVPEKKIITTSLWSSELSKLIANAFLAQRISSINSVSAICEETGADVQEVALAVGADKRIGNHFLKAGPGFGGSCFKKDILNLVYICNHYGLYEVASYWQKVIEINDWQQKRISTLIVEKLFGTLSGKKISILGFSFKANTNDTRESPSIKICKELLEEGANLAIYDPRVNRKQIEIDLKRKNTSFPTNSTFEGSWSYCQSIKETSFDSDAMLILTEWDEFKEIDWYEISKIMRKPSWIFDTRSIANLIEAKKYGLNTWRIGI